ncbi:MAG: ATP-grasp domain-containing protein, partial [Anaerolineales bacterium]|nr:ATP-grasp domain-containing protein [Anaerolineales bacterium]
LAYAHDHPVAAILGVDDSGTVLAARAGAALGLPHNAPQAAEAASDKAAMRAHFAAAGVPSPPFQKFSVRDDPEEIVEAVGEGAIGFPCVLKPTRLSASKGVMRADNAFEFLERFERLKRILAKEGCDDLVVESFIPGREVALEGLLQAGRLTVLALFDKPDPLDGPFFEETIYVTPSRLPAETQAAIAATAQAACAALGLREGPVHAELRVNAGGPVLVEVAARSIGGLCARTLRFTHNADVSLEELILRQALGQPAAAAERERQAGGVMMIPIPGAGLLKGVAGLAAAEAVPGIEAIEITAPLDQPLTPLPEGDSYLGFIFARGATPGDVEDALRQAHAHLRFEIVPAISLEPRRPAANF